MTYMLTYRPSRNTGGRSLSRALLETRKINFHSSLVQNWVPLRRRTRDERGDFANLTYDKKSIRNPRDRGKTPHFAESSDRRFIACQVMTLFCPPAAVVAIVMTMTLQQLVKTAVCMTPFVADLPRVVGHQHPGQVYFVRSLPGRLECSADANPPVNHVVWTKDDRPIAEYSSTGYSGLAGGSHSGTGHIVSGPGSASTGAGTGHQMQQHQTAGGGSSQQQSSTAPVPRIKVTPKGSLVFHSSVASDTGVYSCTPYSTLGKGQPSAPIHVFVKGWLQSFCNVYACEFVRIDASQLFTFCSGL